MLINLWLILSLGLNDFSSGEFIERDLVSIGDL